jgi:hypothetical protein
VAAFHCNQHTIEPVGYRQPERGKPNNRQMLDIGISGLPLWNLEQLAKEF